MHRRLEAVRQLREEAEKLRLVCVAAAKDAAILHIAYDQSALPLDESFRTLLGKLK